MSSCPDMHRHCRAVLLMLLASALFAACAPKGLRFARDGKYGPVPRFTGMSGTTVRSTSIGGELNSPLLPIDDNIVLSFRRSDSTCRLQCYAKDSLATVWRTDYRSISDGDVDETNLRFYAWENKIEQLTSRIDDDSIYAVARTFDQATGKLERDTVVMGLEIPPELLPEYRVIRSDISWGKKYAIVYLMSRYIDERAMDVDLVLMGTDLKPVTRRRIRFNHLVNESLVNIQVDDEGDIFLLSQTDNGKIQMIKIKLLGEEKQQVLTTDFHETVEMGGKLMDFEAAIEDPYTVRLMAATFNPKSGGSIAGVAVAKMDFRDDTVSNRHIVPIQEKDLKQGSESLDMRYPVFVNWLIKNSSPSYVMFFEQRSSPASNPNVVNCDNVMMIGLEKNGDLKWCSGFHKGQVDYTGSFISGSFATQFISDGVLRFSYGQNGMFFKHDFTINDGKTTREAGPLMVADMSRTGGGKDFYLRRSIRWIDEKTGVMAAAVDEGGVYDIKLCKIELGDPTHEPR